MITTFYQRYTRTIAVLLALSVPLTATAKNDLSAIDRRSSGSQQRNAEAGLSPSSVIDGTSQFQEGITGTVFGRFGPAEHGPLAGLSGDAAASFVSGYAQIKISKPIVLYPVRENKSNGRSDKWFSLTSCAVGPSVSETSTAERVKTYWMELEASSASFEARNIRALKLPAGAVVFVGKVAILASDSATGLEISAQRGSVGLSPTVDSNSLPSNESLKQRVFIPNVQAIDHALVQVETRMDASSSGIGPVVQNPSRDAHRKTANQSSPKQSSSPRSNSGPQDPKVAAPGTSQSALSQGLINLAGQLQLLAKTGSSAEKSAPAALPVGASTSSGKNISSSKDRGAPMQYVQSVPSAANLLPLAGPVAPLPAQTAGSGGSTGGADLRKGPALRPVNSLPKVQVVQEQLGRKPAFEAKVNFGGTGTGGTERRGASAGASSAGSPGDTKEIEWTFPEPKQVANAPAQPEAATWIDSRTGKAEPAAIPSPSNSATWIDARTGEVTPPADAAPTPSSNVDAIGRRSAQTSGTNATAQGINSSAASSSPSTAFSNKSAGGATISSGSAASNGYGQSFRTNNPGGGGASSNAGNTGSGNSSARIGQMATSEEQVKNPPPGAHYVNYYGTGYVLVPDNVQIDSSGNASVVQRPNYTGQPAGAPVNIDSNQTADSHFSRDNGSAGGGGASGYGGSPEGSLAQAPGSSPVGSRGSGGGTVSGGGIANGGSDSPGGIGHYSDQSGGGKSGDNLANGPTGGNQALGASSGAGTDVATSNRFGGFNSNASASSAGTGKTESGGAAGTAAAVDACPTSRGPKDPYPGSEWGYCVDVNGKGAACNDRTQQMCPLPSELPPEQPSAKADAADKNGGNTKGASSTNDNSGTATGEKQGSDRSSGAGEIGRSAGDQQSVDGYSQQAAGSTAGGRSQNNDQAPVPGPQNIAVDPAAGKNEGYVWDETRGKWVGDGINKSSRWSFTPSKDDPSQGKWEYSGGQDTPKPPAPTPSPSLTPSPAASSNPSVDGAVSNQSSAANEPDDYSEGDALLANATNQNTGTTQRFNDHLKSSGLTYELEASRTGNLNNCATMRDTAQKATAVSNGILIAGVGTCMVLGAQEIAQRSRNKGGGSGAGSGGVGSGKYWMTGDLYYEDANKTFNNGNSPAQTAVTIRYNTEDELGRHIANYKSQGLLFNWTSKGGG